MDTVDQAWARLDTVAAQSRPRIETLFDLDPQRLARLSLDACGIVFDFSKQAVDAATIEALSALANAAGVAAARARLFAGEVVNASEARAATHIAERAEGVSPAVAAMVAAVEGGAFGAVRHILHLGIGGSALGPALVLDALRDGHRYDAAVVSNIDGAALAPLLARFDPRATLLVVASKSFTTQETFRNSTSALAWMKAGGVADPIARTIAVTTAPAKARAMGAEHVLAFPETVGGRYSLWSAVGVTAALTLGIERWQALLAGAAAMDAHFADAPRERNAPLLAAMIDVWNAGVLRHPTRAVFPYDERLRLLVAHLQQVEMESNGKRVAADGAPLSRPSAAVTWGATGTDAQHAVFQWMHQGTGIAPAEFVVARTGGAPGLSGEHHRGLVANCLAQGAALMRGRDAAAALALAGGDAALAAARTFPGDRPSTTILLDRLDAGTLGALLAFYEHRVFAAATMFGINPFDQWGVELGKEMAATLAGGTRDLDPSTAALTVRAGL